VLEDEFRLQDQPMKALQKQTDARLLPPGCEKVSLSWKKRLFAVDGVPGTANLLTPPEAGPDICRGGSRVFWDCKLELNFVPA
jgi:hypothetical protein